MFGNLSWEHILVLVVVGLVILGPGAASGCDPVDVDRAAAGA